MGSSVCFVVVTFTYIFVVIPKPWLDQRIFSPIQMGLVLSVISWLVFLSMGVPAGFPRRSRSF